MATNKPDLTRVWAATAPGTNIIDPDTTTPGKVAAGWQAEIPPFEHFNFLQKWFTAGLAHANEQGIMVWDANTIYPQYGLAKGSNGLLYEAITEQAGNDPTADDTNWHIYGVAKTFVQLRLIEPRADYEVIFLAGHTNMNTGEGLFIFKSTEVSSDNNGTKALAPNSKIWARMTNGYGTPEMYGSLSDGTGDDTIAIQAALDNHAVVKCEGSDYRFTNLTINGNQRTFSMAKMGWFTTTSNTADAITIGGTFNVLQNIWIRGSGDALDGTVNRFHVTGFLNELNNCYATGQSRSALLVDGKECRVIRGQYKSALVAGIEMNVPDTFLDGPYCESNRDGVVARAGFNAVHVHSVGNSRMGFFMSGASHSQLTSCYGDTNGVNAYDVRDSGGGITFTDCWGFNSGFIANDSVDFQFFNCRNITMTGCRSNGEHIDTAGSKQGSIRFSGDANVVSLYGCWADREVTGLPLTGDTLAVAPINFIDCTGLLTKYSGQADSYVTPAIAVVASSTATRTLRIRADEAPDSPSVITYEATITVRPVTGTSVQHTKFIIMHGNAIGFPLPIVEQVYTVGSDMVDLAYNSMSYNPTADSFVKLGDLSLTITNKFSSTDIRCGMSIRRLETSNGFN
tara:strand:+ start:27664 stop:29538 length:1875 start_codon:yes stop_codon:yes gene_type:complete